MAGAVSVLPSARNLSASAASVDHVTIAVEADVSTMDPQNEPTTNFSQLRQSFENLIRIDEHLKIQPALATSWKMTDDTTWVFTLRDGVKFHNGDLMTADDVAWGLNRILSAGATSGPQKAYIAWLKSATALDAKTVELKTKVPYPSVLAASYIPIIIPKAYFEKVGAEGFNKAPIGTGPYKIDAWSVNQKLELSAFADYWGGEPTIPKATFRVIPDESTRINELKTGGVDIVLNLSPARVADLKNQQGITITSKPSVLNFYLGMNTHKAPFDNLKVRQAIAAAIDVPTMIKALLAGYGSVANSLVHATSFGWNKDLVPFPYDPNKAKQLLAEAGLEKGFTSTFLVGPGLWPATKETGEAISGFLADVGIKAPTTVLEWGDFFDRYRNGKLDGLFLWGNSSPGLEPSLHLNLNFHSPPTGRGLYWSSPEVDQLIDTAIKNLDPTTQAQEYEKIQQILHDQVAAVPLWNYDEVDAVGSRVTWQARGDYYIQVAEVKPA